MILMYVIMITNILFLKLNNNKKESMLCVKKLKIYFLVKLNIKGQY